MSDNKKSEGRIEMNENKRVAFRLNEENVKKFKALIKHKHLQN